MQDFTNYGESNGFRFKLWRGEQMCLLGFDVDEPEEDFVGFAIEYKEPGETNFKRLHNRIAFSYDAPVADAVTGQRTFPTTEAPLQTFRWVHFPWEPRPGTYVYRATKMHMPQDTHLVRGTSIELPIDLDPVTFDGFLDVGFTRNFASSQAFEAKKAELHLPQTIIPTDADKGLDFVDTKHGIAPTGIYEWLGFEAYRLLFSFLDWARQDQSIEIDAMCYDLNEPDIVAALEALGPRLRVIIDDSVDVDKDTGKVSGHGAPQSAETAAEARLATSAGRDRVQRGHFGNLQHNKVLIARQNGKVVRALGGSTNFSYRGLYVQANNMIVYNDGDVADLFARMFDLAFTDMAHFKADALSKTWHSVSKPGKPVVRLCFAPHTHSELSLGPAGAAIDQATSSVFYSFAFMNQTKGGAVRLALNRLMKKPLFSYGVVNQKSGMEVLKPNGEVGLVDFEYLAKFAPEPFKTEWSTGGSIVIHHKFAVADFDLPTAKVYCGSSNFAPTGESQNGDHMVLIEDQRVATVYAIEALRMFDHLNFRTKMAEDTKDRPKELTLQKPKAISKSKTSWFDKFYVAGSRRERDRLLFSKR